jgi:hypothetical protein
MSAKRCASKSKLSYRRWMVRCQVYQCFCENREIPADLLAQAKELDIFAGRPPVSDEYAVAYIKTLSALSRKDQRKDWSLFQCWFVVGAERFRTLSRTERELSSGSHMCVDAVSISYHMTGRRCGSKGHVASCPRMPCRC